MSDSNLPVLWSEDAADVGRHITAPKTFRTCSLHCVVVAVTIAFHAQFAVQIIASGHFFRAASPAFREAYFYNCSWAIYVTAVFRAPEMQHEFLHSNFVPSYDIY